MYERYFDAAERILREAREVNRDAISAAAKIVADAVSADGIVRTFGTGHSELLAREMFDRAGGLAPIDVILDAAHGHAENLEGYAATLLHEDQLRPPDCLIVASTSGRNVAPIEMALIARERGVPVIAVTSVAFSQGVASRHLSGQRLADVADVVLDTRVPAGDAVVTIPGVMVDVGPVSTVVGAALVNAVLVEAVAILAARGVDVPVFASQNVDGNEERNALLNKRYRGRIRELG